MRDRERIEKSLLNSSFVFLIAAILFLFCFHNLVRYDFIYLIMVIMEAILNI